MLIELNLHSNTQHILRLRVCVHLSNRDSEVGLHVCQGGTHHTQGMACLRKEFLLVSRKLLVSLSEFHIPAASLHIRAIFISFHFILFPFISFHFVSFHFISFQIFMYGSSSDLIPALQWGLPKFPNKVNPRQPWEITYCKPSNHPIGPIYF